jgi:hypothetical protein
MKRNRVRQIKKPPKAIKGSDGEQQQEASSSKCRFKSQKSSIQKNAKKQKMLKKCTIYFKDDIISIHRILTDQILIML